MKKIIAALTILSVLTACSSKTTKNTDAATAGVGSGGGIVSETTGAGTANVDSSAMNFSPTGSDSGSIDGLQTVHFEYDKATLTPTEQKKLENNAQWLGKNNNMKMLIEGHCDQRGSTEYNLSLGERRANTVKQMLVQLGVSGDRLNTTSFGKEKPVATGENDSEMAKNRRANFIPTR